MNYFPTIRNGFVDSRIFLVIILSMIMLAGSANAISLGSLLKDDFREISGGEEGDFNILVWNRESEPYPLVFEVDSYPKGWNIVIEPRELSLSNSPQGDVEGMSLPGVDKVIMAKKVKVIVSVPAGEDGKHEILLRAIAGDRKSDISVLQERTFRLRVGVTEYKNENTPQIGRFFEDLSGRITGFASRKNSTSEFVIILVAVVFIVLVIWRVYNRE